MHLPPDSDIPLPPEGGDPNESFFEGGASARVDFEGEPLTRSECRLSATCSAAGVGTSAPFLRSRYSAAWPIWPQDSKLG